MERPPEGFSFAWIFFVGGVTVLWPTLQLFSCWCDLFKRMSSTRTFAAFKDNTLEGLLSLFLYVSVLLCEAWTGGGEGGVHTELSGLVFFAFVVRYSHPLPSVGAASLPATCTAITASLVNESALAPPNCIVYNTAELMQASRAALRTHCRGFQESRVLISSAFLGTLWLLRNTGKHEGLVIFCATLKHTQ